MSPSCSGNSTFIRLLNRIERHERGDVTVNGVPLTDDLRDIDSVRRGVGIVFQGFNLFSHMTVLDNVTLAPRRVLKLDRHEVEAVAMQKWSLVGMERFVSRKPERLSGGEQQRVAIARALAMGPRLMLFDEPTSNLDTNMVQEVLDVMRGLVEQHMTLLAVTHKVDFARQALTGRCCLTRVGLSKTGRLRSSLAGPAVRGRADFFPACCNSTDCVSSRLPEHPICRVSICRTPALQSCRTGGRPVCRALVRLVGRFAALLVCRLAVQAVC